MAGELRRLRAARSAGMVALALTLAGCGAAGSRDRVSRPPPFGGRLSGTGARLPAALYKRWGAAFKLRNGTDLSYEPVGSANGIAQFTSGLGDFGASDVPLNAVELAAARGKGEPLQVPVAMAAIAVVYRLPPGAASSAAPSLRLDGPTLAGIFLGRIRRWDDPALRRLNPRLRLPTAAIRLLHRADASGETERLTRYLAGASPDWARRIDVAKAVPWPVGTGVTGPDALAAAVASTPGALGYAGLARAQAAGLATAWLAPRGAAPVAPRPDRGYPLAAPTYLLAYQDPCRAKKDVEAEVLRLRAWLRFALGSAQALTVPGLAALPAALRESASAQVETLRCGGRRLP